MKSDEEEVSDLEEEDWLCPISDGLDYEKHAAITHGPLPASRAPGGHSIPGTKTSTTQVESSEDPKDKTKLDQANLMSRMQLNDNKAGMAGLDRERINKIIYEASKGSRFYENEMKKEKQVTARIEEQQRRLALLSSDQIETGIKEADVLIASLERSRDFRRTIVHIDMDAFYAAVEMRDKPALKNVPMAVGGMSMLSTSNYLARRYGVRAAMPGFIGKKLCPDLVIVPTNFDKYTAVSRQVRAVLADYDPNFCPMSLDEAYLDITEHSLARVISTDKDRTFWIMLREDEVCCCGDRSNSKENREGNDKKGIEDAAQSIKGIPNLSDACRNESIGGHTNDVSVINKQFTSDSLAAGSIHGSGVGLTVNQEGNQDVKGQEQGTRHANPAIELHEESSSVTENQEKEKDGKKVCDHCGLPLNASVGKQETFGISIEEAVREMRARIHWETKLTASAGIAPNTMLAKVCSDKNKPNGQFHLPSNREAVLEFMKNLDIRKVCGIGKVAERMLRSLGIATCEDLYTKRGILYHLYSNISFNSFVRISMGIGSTTVERDGERKSMSVERTFRELHDPKDLYQKCEELSISLAEDLNEEHLIGKTVGIKLKTVSFELKTRSHTLLNPTSDGEQIYSAARELLRTEILLCQPEPLRLRLMESSTMDRSPAAKETGVRMANLVPKTAAGEQRQCTITSLLSKMKAKPSKTRTVDADPNTASDSKSLSVSYDLAGPDQKDNTSTCAKRNHLDADLKQKGRPKDTEEGQSESNTASLRLRSGRVARRIQTYVCPVCTRTVEAADLDGFNQHIDGCLNTGSNAATSEETVSADHNHSELTEGADDSSLCQDPQSAQSDEKGLKQSTPSRDLGLETEPATSREEPPQINSSMTVKEGSNTDCPHTQPLPVVKETCGNTDLHNEKSMSVKETTSLTEKDRIREVILEGSSTASTAVSGSGTPELTEEIPQASRVVDRFVCPVCSHFQQTSDLSVFNRHVDECLNQSFLGKPHHQNVERPAPTSQQMKQLEVPCKNTTVQTKAKQKQKQTVVGNTIKKHISSGAIPPALFNDSSIIRRSVESVGAGQEEQEYKGDHQEGMDLCLQCPVCALHQEWTSMETFTHHVDACLNRSAIRELLHNEPGPSTKRMQPSPSAEEPTAKRKKGLGKGFQRIDTFFK